MKRRGAKKGLATLCIGGGMGRCHVCRGALIRGDQQAGNEGDRQPVVQLTFSRRCT